MTAASISLLATIAILSTAAQPQPDSVRERHRHSHERWIAQVEDLAKKLDAAGESDAAASIRARYHVAEPPDGLAISILPASDRAAPNASGTARNEWQNALSRIDKAHAKELFDMASLAFRAGDISACYDLVRDVIEHDPDHGPARALMGFTKYRDQWVTPFAAAKLRGGQVWHDRFGWIPKSHVPRFEDGQQLWKGQWLPAAEVAKYRELWANAWEVETEHYVIKTNTSLERGVAFAVKLEKLYSLFFRLFAGFFSPRDQIGMLFDPPNRRTALGKLDEAARRPQRKFRVHFYRTRDEYTNAVRPYVKSGLDATTGMYLTGTRTAYFYLHESMNESTVIHEATHQLFSETREHRHGDGSRGNFWVLEGIACYIESFQEQGDTVVLGSWDTPRLKLGRGRLAKFVPVEKFVQLEMKDFDGPAVYDLYIQAACLCHFLMHHDGGRYREATVRYIEEVYFGRADHGTLAELLDTDFATLNRQFHEHVAEGKYR